MKNFAGVSLPIATAIVVVALPVYLIMLVLGLLTGLAGEYVEPAFLGIFNGIVQFLLAVIGLVLGSFIAGGVAEFALKVARGQSPGFAEVFSGGRFFGSFLVGSFGFYVAVGIGMLLCVIPGYIVQFGLWPFAFIIVDQRLGGIDALKKAWEMTKGYKLSIFVYWLLSILVYLAGALACGIGALLVSLPIIILGSAHMYLSLKGEPPRLA